MGEGGSFGGGGAGSSFETPGAAPGFAPQSLASSDIGSKSSGLGDFFSDLDVDDDFAKILLLALVVIVLLFLTSYVIYIAPSLLAEVLVDGVLASGLYRHLKRAERRHWMATALRKAWWYFLLVALLLMGAGAMMQSWYPAAESIGEVWELLNA